MREQQTARLDSLFLSRLPGRFSFRNSHRASNFVQKCKVGRACSIDIKWLPCVSFSTFVLGTSHCRSVPKSMLQTLLVCTASVAMPKPSLLFKYKPELRARRSARSFYAFSMRCVGANLWQRSYPTLAQKIAMSVYKTKKKGMHYRQAQPAQPS